MKGLDQLMYFWLLGKPSPNTPGAQEMPLLTKGTLLVPGKPWDPRGSRDFCDSSSPGNAWPFGNPWNFPGVKWTRDPGTTLLLMSSGLGPSLVFPALQQSLGTALRDEPQTCQRPHRGPSRPGAQGPHGNPGIHLEPPPKEALGSQGLPVKPSPPGPREPGRLHWK